MATKKEQGQQKQGLWGKIQDWYAQPGIQMGVGMVYSIGAAVVIVGALFKIMHWPGAGVMLTAGMMTEAILFTIGIFEKPHATYHWEHVFPSLVEEEANPLNISGNIGGGVGVAMPGMEKMSDEDAKKLTESIKNMSETAAQLANISRVAGLTDSYANQSQASLRLHPIPIPLQWLPWIYLSCATPESVHYCSYPRRMHLQENPTL